MSVKMNEVCSFELDQVRMLAERYAAEQNLNVHTAHLIKAMLRTASPTVKRLISKLQQPGVKLEHLVQSLDEHLSNKPTVSGSLTYDQELWTILGVTRAMATRDGYANAQYNLSYFLAAIVDRQAMVMSHVARHFSLVDMRRVEATCRELYPAEMQCQSLDEQSLTTGMNLPVDLLASFNAQHIAAEGGSTQSRNGGVVITTRPIQSGSPASNSRPRDANNGGGQLDADELNDPLSAYTTDLSARVRDGLEDPVIGRNVDVQAAINVLCCRQRNNPLMVGDLGVGRSSVVRGIVSAILDGAVPKQLAGMRVMQLDIAALKAGASFQGQLEKRVRALLKAIQDDGNILLFVPNLHALVGGSNSQTPNVVGDMLKPALTRGHLRCIGTTTVDAYKKQIETDKALENAFMRLNIAEPTTDLTVEILRGLKSRFEAYHNVRIGESALRAAAELSKRHIQAQFLPDKAIRLVDSAAARLSIAQASKPNALVEKESDLRHLTQQILFLEAAKSEDTVVAELSSLRERKAVVQRELDALNEQLRREKVASTNLGELEAMLIDKEQLAETYRRQAMLSEEAAVRNEIHNLRATIQEVTNLREASKGNDQLIRDQVEAQDIAELVAEMTGIPAARMTQNECDRLIQMEEILGEQVKGQDVALHAVSDVVRRNRAGIDEEQRPIGSFLFTGPTGSGKTELTKALAGFLFDDPTRIVRLDMGEFQSKESVSRLIGAPAGYVGYEEGGMLTEQVRQNPYCVVLMDEVEKAHPNVFDVLLPILDEGYCTDSQGRRIDFKNTIVILTSNLGSADIHDLLEANASEDAITETVMESIRTHFRPEFIARMDEVVVFRPLSKDAIHQIVENSLRKLFKRMEKTRGIQLTADEAVLRELADRGYDPTKGARNVNKQIRLEIKGLLTNSVLAGTIVDNGTYRICIENDTFVIKEVSTT